MVCLLAAGCGSSAESHLTRTTPADGAVELKAVWTYSSFEVDVTLTLVTREAPDSCVSTGTLVIDKAFGATTSYALAPTDCAELELTSGGDIVLQGDPTGHDWASETLAVDTDRELVTLGPVTLTDAEGNAVSYRFTLSAPPCPDAPGCSCGVLERTAGNKTLDLSLGRRC